MIPAALPIRTMGGGRAEMRPVRPLRCLLPQRPAGLPRHVLPERPGRAGAAGRVVPVLRGGGRPLGRLPEGREQRPAELLPVVLILFYRNVRSYCQHHIYFRVAT